MVRRVKGRVNERGIRRATDIAELVAQYDSAREVQREDLASLLDSIEPLEQQVWPPRASSAGPRQRAKAPQPPNREEFARRGLNPLLVTTLSKLTTLSRSERKRLLSLGLSEPFLDWIAQAAALRLEDLGKGG